MVWILDGLVLCDAGVERNSDLRSPACLFLTGPTTLNTFPRAILVGKLSRETISFCEVAAAGAPRSCGGTRACCRPGTAMMDFI